MVVVAMVCYEVFFFYRRSTTRFLHDRRKEHLAKSNHNIELKIITRENDPVNLRLHEAYYIRKYKPGLNSREECAELNDLFFTHILEHFIKSLAFMRPPGYLHIMLIYSDTFYV